MDMALTLLGVIGVWGIGIAFSVNLLPKPAKSSEPFSHIVEVLGLGVILGFGGTALFYLLWGMSGLSYTSPLSYIWMSMGIIIGISTLFVQNRSLKQKTHCTESTAEIDFKRLCLGILLFLSVSTILQCLMTPQRFWDERAIFGLKAIVIFQEATIQSDSLLHPDFVQYHPKYPLLIPLNEAHFYLLFGEVNDRWSKIIFPMLYVGMTLTFLGTILQLTRQKVRTWLFTLMLATVPVMVPFEYGFLSGQADGPIACFHTVTLLYLWRYLSGLKNPEDKRSSSTRYLIIAGLTAGMTIFTKDEGIAFFLIDLIALSIITLIYFRNQFVLAVTSIFKFGITTVIVVAPWFYHREQLPSTTEMGYFSRMQISTFAEGMAALTWAIQHLLWRMFLQAGKWGLQWWMLILSFVAFPLKAIKPNQLFLLLNILGALAALLIAGMIAPTAVEEHIGESSQRFLMQISGAAVLFIAGQWICDQE
ncbi:hypothetical protein [Gimesia aquarii]|uniref:Glycosyltransferase RgtA/B/C/D-like domain-containing protein n=1 Tax=Gimesia aquarii TaxID=2527964 RepID=A0A517X1K5_9PLAN|nr:hypothetical protein [Gimesia aquarii]QDU11387.1 hypothetical protein V202x_48080 [Gimesia aquarii]